MHVTSLQFAVSDFYWHLTLCLTTPVKLDIVQRRLTWKGVKETYVIVHLE